MHKILERQLKRIYGDNEAFRKENTALLDVIAKTYEDYEKEYALMERSLNISSKELTEVNKRLRSEVDEARERALELEKLNKVMINREIKMVELKEELGRLKSEVPQGE